MKITFTNEEIELLKKEKDYNPFPIVRKRCEVIYLKSQGFTNKEIVKIVGISYRTVTNCLKLYQQGRISALKTLNYKGQPSELHSYKEQIKASLEEKPVRTLKEAKARIKEITGIELSIPQIKYFLDQIGAKRRKIGQIPDKLDIEKQETFKKKRLTP